MADAADSKSAAPCGRVGSTPISGTRFPPFPSPRARAFVGAALCGRPATCRERGNRAPLQSPSPRGERVGGVRASALFLAVDHVDPGGRLVRAVLDEGDAHVVADLEVGEVERLVEMADE